MKKSSKIVWITLIILIFGVLITCVPDEDGEYFWNPFDYARITELDYKAVLVDEPESNGKVVVTERLTFDVHAAFEHNLFWELWRDLPERYIDGVRVTYKVNSVKQIFKDRPDVIYTESPKLYWDDSDYTSTFRGYGPDKWFHSKGPFNGYTNFECLLFYVNGLYRDTVVFEIEYEMYNAALRYADSSELYLPFYDASSAKYLKSVKGEILIPVDKMPKEGNYYANTYGTNANSFPYEKSSTKNKGYTTFSFSLNEKDLKFKPHNSFIEFALVSFGEDKHAFTEYASRNMYYDEPALEELKQEQKEYDDLPKKDLKNKIIVLIISVAGASITIWIVVSTDKRMRKKHKFYNPSAEIEYFRDIPSELDPNFAASLVLCRENKKDITDDGYSAIMLSLANKGYIELARINSYKEWDSKNVRIIVKYHPALPPLQSINNGLTGSYTQTTQPMLPPQPIKVCSKCGNPNVEAAVNCVFCSTPLSVENNILVTNSSIPNETRESNIFQQVVVEEQVTLNLKPLTITEEQYFNLILRHSGGFETTIRSFEEKISNDYENTNSFVKNMESSITNIGVSNGYFQKADYKGPKQKLKANAKTLAIIGIIILVLGNIITYNSRLDFAFGGIFILGITFIESAIYLNKISKRYILLTKFGEDEYAKWRGLYNFLNSETLLNERTVLEVYTWEKYLIYATAFGISEKVVAALKVRCTLVDTSLILNSNSYYRSGRFRSYGRSFGRSTRNAFHNSMRSSRGYGGYGGRGGFGGGGGH